MMHCGFVQLSQTSVIKEPEEFEAIVVSDPDNFTVSFLINWIKCYPHNFEK